MKVYDNISLAERNTFKVGGIAEHFYIPENTEDV